MTDIRLSFVLASYNGSAFVEEQIQSILSQLTECDELIISDDGSSDDTVAKILGVGDPRIRLIADGGRLGYQRNFERAIAFARGRYIFFSDQDDICLPGRVERSLAALMSSDCVCGDAVVVDERLNVIEESYFAVRKARFGVMMLLARPSVIGATLACRRAFLIDNMPFPVGVPHDMWLSIQAARRRQLTVIREPFILYRRHQSAASATASARRRPTAERLIERLRVVRALWRWPSFGRGGHRDG